MSAETIKPKPDKKEFLRLEAGLSPEGKAQLIEGLIATAEEEVLDMDDRTAKFVKTAETLQKILEIIKSECPGSSSR